MDPVLFLLEVPAPKCNGKRPEIPTLHTVTDVVEGWGGPSVKDCLTILFVVRH